MILRNVRICEDEIVDWYKLTMRSTRSCKRVKYANILVLVKAECLLKKLVS